MRPTHILTDRLLLARESERAWFEPRVGGPSTTIERRGKRYHSPHKHPMALGLPAWPRSPEGTVSYARGVEGRRLPSTKGSNPKLAAIVQHEDQHTHDLPLNATGVQVTEVLIGIS